MKKLHLTDGLKETFVGYSILALTGVMGLAELTTPTSLNFDIPAEAYIAGVIAGGVFYLNGGRRINAEQRHRDNETLVNTLADINKNLERIADGYESRTGE